MFTGIIEAVGRVDRVQTRGGTGRSLRIVAPFAPELRVDESVAVNGACQTVVAADAAGFEVVAVEETLAKTTLGRLKPGDPVNLERAVRVGDRLDGHLVQGHVDGTERVVSVEPLASSHLVTFSLQPAFRPHVIEVGSIAVDGVSLTVARLAESTFTVAVIPHTFAHTNADTWSQGVRVNVELDLIGKYVARWMAARTGAAGAGVSGGGGPETSIGPGAADAGLSFEGLADLGFEAESADR